MILDIVFEGLLPEVDTDGFSTVTEANGGIDRDRGTYIFKDVAYNRRGFVMQAQIESRRV